MFEMAFWYFDYAEFSETGIRPTGTTVWAVAFGTVKRTVTRLIILIVSMGYGVVRPTFGGLTSKVVMLGGTFFVASEVLELVEHVVLDVFFILWIFTSISATLNKLQARRMMIKLDMYRKFTNALAVAVVVYVGWICYEWKTVTGVKSMLVGNGKVDGSGVGADALHAQTRAIFCLKFENENSDQEGSYQNILAQNGHLHSSACLKALNSLWHLDHKTPS
ncbi:hypothetical protein P8452_28133 [Trifolium repens]|nr:hypothetical protein P8452_28133 [Trifolium repens]